MNPPSTELQRDREALRQLLLKCVQRGSFKLASGKTSDLYIDGRLVTLSPMGLVLMARVIHRMTAEADGVTAVGGPTMGADPISAAVAVVGTLEFKRQWNAFIVRKEAKAHGTGKQIEGPALTAASKVLMVEDVVTSGGSVLTAVEAVKATGATVLRVIPLLDRLEGAAEAFAKAGVELRPIFTRHDLG